MAWGRDIRTVYPWRLAILGAAMLGLWGLLPWRLWNLQVRQGSEKRAQLARQSLRSIRVAGVRGRLLDRNGVPLAENRPSYCLSLYLEDLRRPGKRQNTIDAVMDTLDRLAETMDRPRRLDAKDVATHLNRRTPLALTAWRDLDPTAVARFLDYLLRERGCPRVCASYFPGNESSRRVMEKCGMRFWRVSEKELSYLGRERDLIYYEIGREDKAAE